MPIDRTWYNTLVDDDGSGTTGTAIDKDDFNQFIVDIDKSFAAGVSWTPTLSFGGATTGITYSIQSGSYNRIETLIIAEFRILLTSKGTATGAASIGGLPFAALMNPAFALDIAAGMVGLTGAPLIVLSSSAALPMQYTATARTQLTDAHFSNTSDIRAGLIYRK